MLDREGLTAQLDEWGIKYDAVDHEPVLTMAESATLTLALTGERCKNLLLQDKRGGLYIVVAPADHGSLDLKSLRDQIGSARLSFARPDAMAQLGVPAGAMSPLALVNRGDNAVGLVLDERLRDAEALLFHPLANSATLRLTPAAFTRFLERAGLDPIWVELA